MDCASYSFFIFIFFYQDGGFRVFIVGSNETLEILLREECLCDNLYSPPLTACTVKDTLVCASPTMRCFFGGVGWGVYWAISDPELFLWCCNKPSFILHFDTPVCVPQLLPNHPYFSLVPFPILIHSIRIALFYSTYCGSDMYGQCCGDSGELIGALCIYYSIVYSVNQ